MNMPVTVKIKRVVTEELEVPVQLGDTLVLGNGEERLLIGRDISNNVYAVNTETYTVGRTRNSIQEIIRSYERSDVFKGIVDVKPRP